MGCISDKDLRSVKIRKQHFQTKYQNSLNPIIRIAKQWNVESIKERWHDNEIDVIKSKLGPKQERISKEQFISLLPALTNFSIITQDSFYELFNYQQNNPLIIKNFVITQIIILKSDDYDLLGDMFFFVYSSDPNKNYMNQNDYNRFAKQFKQHQLQFMHQTVKPTKNQKGQIFIDKRLFREIFQQYDMQTIKQLFRFNLKEEERKFQKYLSSYGIDRKKQSQVFMVDFLWFLKWKNYMEYKYGIRVDIKENGRNLNRQQLEFLTNTAKSNEKWLHAGQKLATQSEQPFMEPINNDRIHGDQANELKQGLIEYSEFISVPVEVWDQMRVIYGGGPAISKPYPYFYNKKIVLTILDQTKCEFQPEFAKAMIYDPIQTFEDIYKKRQQRYFLKQPIKDLIAYYKHPGELQWKKIKDLKTKIQNFPFQYKSYLVYVKNDIAQKFQQKFNVTEVKGKKQIKERIKNYGSLLTFQHEGILQQGHVGYLFAYSVVVYLKGSKGQYLKIQQKCNQLEKMNPSVLQDNFLQGFAGLENIGNTCYINAPLQCLLKTPYFDEYLDSVNLNKYRKDMLTYQLQQVHEKSKQSRDCISMSNFKKRFDEKFSFFEGNAQHDAQQFLLLLLDKLSQEQPRQSLMGNELQIKKNKKIHSFFSGKVRSETECLKCHNKGKSEQSFFTYSLSLPIINEILFNFYYIDEDFKVRIYGLTVPRDCQVGDLTKMIYKKLNANEQNIIILSVCQGQWMNDIQKLNSSYKIAKLQNYDSAIVCYPIKTKTTPDYEDLVERKIKNSIKVEIRNRVFDRKKKAYKPFHFPFYLQVNHETTGKSLTYSIIDKIKKFVNQEEYHVFKEFQEEFEDECMKLLQNSQISKEKQFSQVVNTEFAQTPNLSTQMKRYRQKFGDFPFTIQYLKNEDGLKSTCWFCKKNIDHTGKQVDSKSDCQGCQFSQNLRLYQDKSFMKGFKNLVIAIDWKSSLFSKDWTVEETTSFLEAKIQQTKRRSNLQILLRQTYDQQQSIDLKCEKSECQYGTAIRKQAIVEAPNILILHLKRFYYKENTFHKLKNKVIIPEVFGLPGFNDKYELYGNVVHYGSGTGRGGHYINYVKVAERWYRCDDEKVNFTKDPNEHLNPDAYLLFYKRQKIDRSWSFFGN